ncbi:MAG TPA: TetR/AcrR family transcriptional regulator, partial [Dehalococcoidia bacterium]|nr:TetR/AcrR family transcriptional regulator [Dehalococcoidia bacterium]
PRNPSADRAILETAVRILEEDGCRSLNIERVAEESGIAKTTIYRRYQDRQDLAAAAVGALLEEHGAFHAPDTGSCQGDLRLAYASMRAAGQSSPLLPVLGAVLAEGQKDAALMERLWERAFGPHHEAVTAVLRRAIDRGEVRPDLDVRTTVELLVGAALARLIPGKPTDDDWIESVIATVWEGMRAQGPGNAVAR